MKEVFINNENLNKEDIDETVIRTKALIINSNNEITLGYCHKTYQFPGGHLEEGEQIENTLKREIKEETGMTIDTSNMKPFLLIRYYNKNYRNTGLNRENLIYYYEVKTELKPDLSNTNYDDWEVKGNYKLVSINLNNIKEILRQSIPDNKINSIIVKEMLIALDNYC